MTNDNDSSEDERRKVVRVADMPTESGIKINNILTALVLMVMSWVGFNINFLKETVTDVKVLMAAQGVELKHTQERLQHHIEDDHKHRD